MKTQIEILRIAVFNKENAKPPTQLTVAYKGWWHMRLLHVPLSLEVLKDGIHATRKAGKITLVQRFLSGEAPRFRVKGRTKQLEVRLYAGRSLRTRGEVNVGDLVSRTAERLVKVPFEEKVDGKVAKAFLTVAQVAPVATPLPPHARETFPAGYNGHHTSLPPCTCPLLEILPKEARLRFLVKQMCGRGPMPAPPKECPLHQSQEICPADCDPAFVKLWKEVFGDVNNS